MSNGREGVLDLRGGVGGHCRGLRRLAVSGEGLKRGVTECVDQVLYGYGELGDGHSGDEAERVSCDGRRRLVAAHAVKDYDEDREWTLHGHAGARVVIAHDGVADQHEGCASVAVIAFEAGEVQGVFISICRLALSWAIAKPRLRAASAASGSVSLKASL